MVVSGDLDACVHNMGGKGTAEGRGTVRAINHQVQKSRVAL